MAESQALNSYSKIRLECANGVASCECGFSVPCRSIVVHLCKKFAAQKKIPCGPGCHMKRILSRFGIAPTGSCKCDGRAAQMDAWGPDECVRRKSEIVGWLRDESSARGLPFVEFIASRIIDMAIRAAREEQKAKSNEAHVQV